MIECTLSHMHIQITMVNAQFSKHVASLETREGCPITPGASFTKTFYLVPVAASNKDRRGKRRRCVMQKKKINP